MRIILQEKIANLGNVGDQVTVKAGYARNYLFPLEKAVPATAVNIAEFDQRRTELEKKAAEVLAAAKSRAEHLGNLSVSIPVQASDEGKLFGSVGPRDIVEAVNQTGNELAKSEVLMPEGPIRQLGEYEITLQLHSEVTSTIKVKIVPSV